MTGVFKPQQRAILALLSALMCFNGRATMRNLARYGAGSAKRLRRWASEGFDLFKLNELLLSETLAISLDLREDERPRQAILIDATFTAKSGKHTEKIDFFHNGSSKSKNKLQRGLEFNLVTALNIDEREAYALGAYQSDRESALDVACAQLIKHKNTYQKISQHVVADGYYARNGFVSALKMNGYELITLLRRDAALRYLYEGEYNGRGRPKRYLGKVDYHDFLVSVNGSEPEETSKKPAPLEEETYSLDLTSQEPCAAKHLPSRLQRSVEAQSSSLVA